MTRFDSRWRPDDALPHNTPITVGCLVGWKYKPWRVISMFDAPRRDSDHPWVKQRHGFVLRPADAEQWPTALSVDEHGTSPSDRPFPVIREHYGLCVHCNELTPCREQEVEWAVERNVEHMARYETPGVCPACGEVVTDRQQRETFPNIVVPGGLPVTFHAGRRACRYSADEYRGRVGTEQAAQLSFGGDSDG